MRIGTAPPPTAAAGTSVPSWREFAVAQFQQAIETPTRFFEANVNLVSQACLEMAKRFLRGGGLLVFGTGASTTDAQHVSVEFVHPVIVGKRALPAIALTNDIGSVLGIMQQAGANDIFARQLELIGTPDDMALGLSIDGEDESVRCGLAVAKAMGMLTLGMCGKLTNDGGAMAEQGLDFCFIVPSHKPQVIQEVQETTYHILWETVHVFFEHKGLF